MGEKGQVIEMSEDLLVVRLTRTEACAKCKACTAGMKTSDMIIKARNLCSAKMDDWVNIELKSENFIKAVLIMYGVPLVFLLAGFYLGNFFAEVFNFNYAKDIISFVFGLIFVLISYVIIKSKEKCFKKESYIPYATEVYEN